MSIILLNIAYYVILNNLAFSLVLTYITSCSFIFGKTYEIELIPPGIIQSEYFPNGLLTQITITISQIYAFIMFLMVIKMFIYKQISNKLPKIYLLIFISTGIPMLSALFASSRPELSIIYAIQGLSIIPFLLLLFQMICTNTLTGKIINYYYFAYIIFQGIICLIQQIKNGFWGSSIEITSYISNNSSVDENIFRFRPLGTFTHPNELAQFIIFILPIVFSFLLIKKMNRLIVLITLISSLFILIVTQARSAWIAITLAGLFFLYITEKKWRLSVNFYPFEKKLLIYGVGCISIMSLFIMPSRLLETLYSFEPSAGGSTRILMMKEWINLILQHPVFGVGPGMSVVEAFYENTTGVLLSFPESVHNVYLLIASEQGLIGLFLLIIFISITVKTGIKRIMTSTIKKKVLILAIISGSIGVYINCFFQPYTGTMLPITIMSLIYIYTENQII